MLCCVYDSELGLGVESLCHWSPCYSIVHDLRIYVICENVMTSIYYSFQNIFQSTVFKKNSILPHDISLFCWIQKCASDKIFVKYIYKPKF